MTDEAEFFAWLDDELAPADAARVAARVMADPALSAKAEAHRVMSAELRGAFHPVMTPRSDVVLLAAKRTERAGRASGRRPAGLPNWAAIAATLVVGIGLGTVVNGQRAGDPPIAFEGRQMVAAAALDDALTRQLASADQQRQATRIGLTFRNQQGNVCRTFRGPATSGLACRDGNNWRIEGVYSAGGGATGDYRMASGADPRMAALVDGMIVGEPFDAAGEAAARQSGWR